MIDSYRGWLRLPGGDWRPAVAGDTEDETWRKLRQHIQYLGVRFVDSFVGPADSDPRRRSARRQAVRQPSQHRMF